MTSPALASHPHGIGRDGFAQALASAVAVGRSGDGTATHDALTAANR